MAVAELTAKQERFVTEYLADCNATQAAIRAGYSRKTAQAQGSRLLSNVMVKEAIEIAQEKLSRRFRITQEQVLEDLARLSEEAAAVGQFAAAIRAKELVGKHLGMFADKVELPGPLQIEIALVWPK